MASADPGLAAQAFRSGSPAGPTSSGRPRPSGTAPGRTGRGARTCRPSAWRRPTPPAERRSCRFPAQYPTRSERHVRAVGADWSASGRARSSDVPRHWLTRRLPTFGEPAVHEVQRAVGVLGERDVVGRDDDGRASPRAHIAEQGATPGETPPCPATRSVRRRAPGAADSPVPSRAPPAGARRRTARWGGRERDHGARPRRAGRALAHRVHGGARERRPSAARRSAAR